MSRGIISENGFINYVDLCLKGCNVYLQKTVWEMKGLYLEFVISKKIKNINRVSQEKKKKNREIYQFCRF